MPDENQRDPKQLAKQGDPKAIATAINHSLKPKGIIADVMRDNGCLHVMLEGEQVPHHQNTLVSFIEKGMKKLDIESVYRIKIYGRVFGDDLPAWEDEIILKTPEQEALDLEEDSIPLLPEFDLDKDGGLNDDDIPEEVLPEDAIVSDDDDIPEENDFDDESIDDDDIDDNDNIAASYNPEEDDDLEEEETEAVKPENKGKILLFVLLVVALAIAALAGLHLSGVYKLPFLSGGSSDSEQVEPAPDEESAPPETPAETAAPEPAADPWTEAVRSSISAAELAQTAQSRTEWENVAGQWEQAAELMRQVPESSPNYQTAQQKATEYENNRQIAVQRAASAPQ